MTRQLGEQGLTDGDVFVNLASSATFLLVGCFGTVLILTGVFGLIKAGVKVTIAGLRSYFIILSSAEDLAWPLEFLLWSLSIAAWTPPLSPRGLKI